MAEQSWLELASVFEGLDPEIRLSLDWSYDPANNKHVFSLHWGRRDVIQHGIPADKEPDGRLTKAKFEAYATRAGAKLRESNPYHLWQFLVRMKSQNSLPGNGVSVDPLTEERASVITGRCVMPCQTSAALCYMLDATPDALSIIWDNLDRADVSAAIEASASRHIVANTAPLSTPPSRGADCTHKADVESFLAARGGTVLKTFEVPDSGKRTASRLGVTFGGVVT